MIVGGSKCTVTGVDPTNGFIWVTVVTRGLRVPIDMKIAHDARSA
jgi:hypothetical protein